MTDLHPIGCRDGSSRIDDHVGGFTHVRVKIANGSEQIRLQCDYCDRVLGPIFSRSRFTAPQLAAMPLAEDWTSSRPPCVRCGAWGTEEHHWAPRSLFGDEADLWPTAWLCPNCHQRWHQTTGAGI